MGVIAVIGLIVVIPMTIFLMLLLAKVGGVDCYLLVAAFIMTDLYGFPIMLDIVKLVWFDHD